MPPETKPTKKTAKKAPEQPVALDLSAEEISVIKRDCIDAIGQLTALIGVLPEESDRRGPIEQKAMYQAEVLNQITARQWQALTT